MKRGQAAFEYMILIGALLVILIPLFNYVSYYSAENVKVEKAEDAVQTLGKTADTLYALGPGNKDYVWIDLPGAIKESKAEGNEVLIKLFIFGADSDFYYTTISEVNGTIPTQRGRTKMKIEVLNNGIVNIEKA